VLTIWFWIPADDDCGALGVLAGADAFALAAVVWVAGGLATEATGLGEEKAEHPVISAVATRATTISPHRTTLILAIPASAG
jgi:hypothetical protein